MARDTPSIVKRSRREGYALHPKAHKVLVKRASKPGQQPRDRRSKASQYAIQLREKQKVKRLYGLLERQFAKLTAEAIRQPGQSGNNLLEMLERRLDNIIYRSGLASSRPAARQLANHGHFLLNGSRVNVPSILLSVGDNLSLREHSRQSSYFKQLDELSPPPAGLPDWLRVDRGKGEIKVLSLPSREEAEPDIQEQLIIEFYSR